MGSNLRYDWSVEQALALYRLPLFELVDRARAVHLEAHPRSEVQLCALLSVKTGGCPENCAYCPQSAHYETEVGREEMLDVPAVLDAARSAASQGATRFCMGAAWREVRDGAQFESVLEMVKGVKALGLEACCTLGMLKPHQAEQLKAAGLDAYNHNIDTSPSHYRSIITTRTQEQRFETLRHVRAAGITICSGGIIGMGESDEDRCAMLVQLARLQPHPESVPINALVRVEGTPLAELPPVDGTELVRMVAAARIMMPRSRVRLSAGRQALDRGSQLLCLYAGANSIFYGEKLLTTANPEAAADRAMLADAGLGISAPTPAG